MKSIHINLGKDSYDIQIETGLLQRAGACVRALTKAQKLGVITDMNVNSLYGDVLENSLLQAGFAVKRMVIPAGEQSKNMDALAWLYQQMSDAGITRSDAVITFGGGVVGDLGGFAAATFLRGIPFIQIPTTIIAQVDSSVGGKVAVDLPSGKNRAGSFYQPKGVLIDPALLVSLPERFVHDGMGEVIKYGCIRDKELFALLETLNDRTAAAHWEEIIERCCITKAQVVENDEFDFGERMILNFGHTIGHAIERFYGYGKYTHGEGVAAGMAMLTGRTEEMGITQKGTAARLAQLLRQYGLPVDVDAPAEELLPYITNDKKMRSDHMTFVVITDIGEVQLRQVKLSEVPEYIRKRES